MMNGKSFKEAAKTANIAAGIVVKKPGTSVITRKELDDELRIQRGKHKKSN